MPHGRFTTAATPLATFGNFRAPRRGERRHLRLQKGPAPGFGNRRVGCSDVFDKGCLAPGAGSAHIRTVPGGPAGAG